MSQLPIIVSLAVMRSRIGSLDRVISSLLAQSVAPAKIVLNVSRQPYLLDQGLAFEDLPEFTRRLITSGKVELYFTENTGPYRKVVPTLRRFGHRPFLLATADDDVVYPKHWLAGLRDALSTRACVAAYRVRAMTAYEGRLFPYNQWPIVYADQLDQSAIRPEARELLLFPTGRGGVMYDSRFFPDLRLIDQLRAFAPAQDDLALRFATMVGRIPVTCVHWSKSGADHWEFPSADTAGPNLFESINAKGGNDEALQRLIAAVTPTGLWRLSDHLLPSMMATAV